jgi:hypothetical protein
VESRKESNNGAAIDAAPIKAIIRL